MRHSSWCCQKCGDAVGWLGRFVFPFLHPCCPNGMKFGRDFNLTIKQCNIKCPEDKREACRVEKAILDYSIEENFMRAIIIDDEPELKAYDKGLNLSSMTVARSVEEGIRALGQNERFDKLYLDCRLLDGSHVDVLTWLSDHLDKVPDVILSVSFMTMPNFYPMVDALQKTARKK